MPPESNAIKVMMVTTYTAIVLAIAYYKGLIDWKIGSIIAIGQGAGGWITAQWSSTFPKCQLQWAYRILIVIMIFTLFHLFYL